MWKRIGINSSHHPKLCLVMITFNLASQVKDMENKVLSERSKWWKLKTEGLNGVKLSEAKEDH
jgi:hypothetical protein